MSRTRPIMDVAQAAARTLPAEPTKADLCRWVVAELKPHEIIGLAAYALQEEIRRQSRVRTRQVEDSVRETTSQLQPPQPQDRTGRRLHPARDHAREERARNLDRQARELVERHARTSTINWTADLLAEAIRMPDGTRVTWGAATIEQHQERREMLIRNVIANTETAALHQSAIDTLTSANVTTLNELAGIAA